MKTLTVIMIILVAAVAVQAQEPVAGVFAQTKVVTGGGNIGFIAEQLVAGSLVKGAPYSAQAVTETVQTLADGNRITQKSTAMIYRDALGRERREETLPAIGPFTPQGDAPQIISIYDPVAGVSYSLNSREHTAIKLPGPSREIAALEAQVKKVQTLVATPFGPTTAGAPGAIVKYKTFNENVRPPKTEQLGWKLIEGVQAEGTRNTITIPAGEVGNERPIDIIDEQWRSPDLQVIVLSKHTDPRFGETSYSLVNISRADPPLTLFQVPPDYTIQDRLTIGIRK
jgi:hypothetical protein